MSIDGFILYRVEKLLDPVFEGQVGKDPAFKEVMGRAAANELSAMIVRDAAVFSRIAPSSEEVRRNPAARVTYRWDLGIQSDGGELVVRARQIDEARREGMLEAAEILRKRAQSYIGRSGVRAHVLEYELAESARAIESHAADKARARGETVRSQKVEF